MPGRMRVSHHSDVPVYRQIVAHLSFMIEAGDLAPGETLPSARLLADNLQINRQTVARAYAELAALGLAESRGRSGTKVLDPGPERRRAPEHTEARRVLSDAVDRCLALGVSPDAVRSLTADLLARAEPVGIDVAFVECNADRADAFARDLQEHLVIPVLPLVLGHLDPAHHPAALVLTTFFHLAEVRALWRGTGSEVIALVVAPHVRTLVQIASVPKDRTVGILYSTEDQAASIRDSLAQSGIDNVAVLSSPEDPALASTDLVVVPSETPELRAGVEGRAEIIEFGNVLDAASLRTVTQVVADLRSAPAPTSGSATTPRP